MAKNISQHLTMSRVCPAYSGACDGDGWAQMVIGVASALINIDETSTIHLREDVQDLHFPIRPANGPEEKILPKHVSFKDEAQLLEYTDTMRLQNRLGMKSWVKLEELANKLREPILLEETTSDGAESDQQLHTVESSPVDSSMAESEEHRAQTVTASPEEESQILSPDSGSEVEVGDERTYQRPASWSPEQEIVEPREQDRRRIWGQERRDTEVAKMKSRRLSPRSCGYEAAKAKGVPVDGSRSREAARNLLIDRNFFNGVATPKGSVKWNLNFILRKMKDQQFFHAESSYWRNKSVWWSKKMSLIVLDTMTPTSRSFFGRLFGKKSTTSRGINCVLPQDEPQDIAKSLRRYRQMAILKAIEWCDAQSEALADVRFPTGSCFPIMNFHSHGIRILVPDSKMNPVEICFQEKDCGYIRNKPDGKLIRFHGYTQKNTIELAYNSTEFFRRMGHFKTSNNTYGTICTTAEADKVAILDSRGSLVEIEGRDRVDWAGESNSPRPSPAPRGPENGGQISTSGPVTPQSTHGQCERAASKGHPSHLAILDLARSPTGETSDYQTARRLRRSPVRRV